MVSVREAAEAAAPGIQNQKQEPHTKMWGKTQLQPPFNSSVDSLCHSWFTTTNLSYRFPIFETSATTLCGYIYLYIIYICLWTKSTFGPTIKQLNNVEHSPERWTILAPLTQPFLRSGDSGNCMSHLMISLRVFCPGQPIAIWKVENERFSNQDICFKELRVNVAKAMLAAATLWVAEAKAQRFTSLWHGPPTPILAGATAILPGLETGVVWPSAMKGTLLKLPECE